MNEVDEVIKRLENKIHVRTAEQAAYIQFEKHTSALGHEYINDLFEAIKSKVALRIHYQPYTQTAPTEKIVYPYLLKEFRNRWFLFGGEKNAQRITIYALDRIKKIKPASDQYLENKLFNPNEYFKHLIGVSVPEGAKPETIEIKVFKQAVPYLVSKPIHFNQQTLKSFKDGSILIQLTLIINYEFKSILLGYGSGLEVKKPKALRVDLKELITEMYRLYK